MSRNVADHGPMPGLEPLLAVGGREAREEAQRLLEIKRRARGDADAGGLSDGRAHRRDDGGHCGQAPAATSSNAAAKRDHGASAATAVASA
jgi:hypothetical protein